MGDFKRGKVVKIEHDKMLHCQVVVLQRASDNSYFVVNDFRMNENYVVGEDKNIPNLEQIDDFVNDKGTKFKRYSNEVQTSDTQTYIDKEGATGDLPTVESLEMSDALVLAGFALNLKANPATTTSLDECAQAVLGYAIKLMRK